MPFPNVTIQIGLDALAPVSRWRQDATAGSVMSFSLSDTTGVNSYQWMLWRPEGSSAGGAGIEPISLGTSSTANITIDIKGTYIVWCMVNGGAGDATIIRGGCAYLESITDSLGRPLRLIGPFETNEDQADPLTQQGIIKMLNRWLDTIAAGGGGGGGGGLPVLTLTGNPNDVETPQAGELSQFGTWGGNLYVHLTNALDINWLNLTDTKALLDGGPYALEGAVTLGADPTITAHAGAQSSFGTFGGNLFIHLTGSTDTNWLKLTGLVSGLPVLTPLVDPTLDVFGGAVGQLATNGGNLFIHLTASTDTNWLKLTGLTGGGLALLSLGADPTVTATAGSASQFGMFGGELFLHLANGTNVEWFNVSSRLPPYTPTFADLTEGELSITMTMTDSTIFTVTKTAAQIKAAAVAQGMGALTNGDPLFPHSDIAALAGKTLDTTIAITVQATVPFRATGGLKQTASSANAIAVHDIYGENVPLVTYGVTLDGALLSRIPPEAHGFEADGYGEYLSIHFAFNGVGVATTLQETSGPTTLTVGSVADGQYLKRVGSTVVGGTPSGGSGGLTTLYSVDFSTLSAQDLTTGGDAVKTIDGKAAWNLKNTANASSVQINDGTHAGLYLRCNINPSDYSGATITGPRLIVGLTDLHGLKNQELIEQWLMVMFSQPHTPNVNYQGLRIGVKLIPDIDETGLSYHLARAYVDALVDLIEQRVNTSSTFANPGLNGMTVPATTDDVVAFRILMNNLLEIYSGSSSEAGFPEIHALKLSAVVQLSGFNASLSGFQQNYPNIVAGGSNSLQWALLIAVSCSTDTSGNSDALIHRMQILGR